MTTSIVNNILYTSGEYIVFAQELPYENVSKFTSIIESFSDAGSGTIMKKEFRYSLDNVSFSEFQELIIQNVQDITLGPQIWFQFRYILLSGGPVTFNRLSLSYEKIPSSNFDNFVLPNNQSEDSIYAFPISYKSNFLWEPYKMNRAIRLYKDLNLMVNTLFGHDSNYYRAIPHRRSNDVILMEQSLYYHDDQKCVKVIVPGNAFPDNKLNMGLFGPDYEMPFEIQIDKDYFQTIFGQGTGPQKRDIIYIPRAGRPYEVSSSYLFRDFMNEPLYFKVTLIKWLPKSNVEQSEDVNILEDFTRSAIKLFGEEMHAEEIDANNPQQYTVATTTRDLVRSYVDLNISDDENLLNYYTVVAEHFYSLKTELNLTQIRVKLSSSSNLVVNTNYYARFLENSTQLSSDYLYSMKILIYLGDDAEGYSIFKYIRGNSIIENSFPVSVIFGNSNDSSVGSFEIGTSEITGESPFQLYLTEYDPNVSHTPIVSCETISPCEQYLKQVVKYSANNSFNIDCDRSFSAWFRLVTNTNTKNKITSCVFDKYSKEVTLTFNSNVQYMYNDIVSLTRISTSNFLLYGRVIENKFPGTIKILVDEETIDFISTFPTWFSFNDLQIQKTYSRVFIDSIVNSKGIRIELIENRHFILTLNSSRYIYSLPNNSTGLNDSQWYGLFVNISNVFKQATLNVWQMQWNPTTNLPATTELTLTYSKIYSNIVREDRSTSYKFWNVPSFMDLTNVRLYSRVVETDKQTLLLNSQIVKEANLGIIIDNAIPQSRLPYIGNTK